ncbi:MAG: slipin family protein [Fimbriimonadaceae bacterium]
MNEAFYIALGAIAVIVIWTVANVAVHTATVYETQRGLLYRHGKFLRVLEAGRHRCFGTGYKVDTVDMRATSKVIGNQEIATKDGVPLKVSLIVRFSVGDPLVFKTKFLDGTTELHEAVQVALREAVASLNVEEFVESRAQIATPITESVQPKALGLGLVVHGIAVRDVVLGGGIKSAMADTVKAQYEGRAALERARAEAATMRSLANTARMLDEQPALAQLRLLQAVESGKATVVIGDASVMPKAK